MLHSIQRLRGVRMVVVLVNLRQLMGFPARSLITELQPKFQLPVMLVAKDDTAWNRYRATAEFDAVPYLLELLAHGDMGDIDWAEAVFPESELPY